MLKHVLHAVWCEGALHVWGESGEPVEAVAFSGEANGQDARPIHPRAMSAVSVKSALVSLGVDEDAISREAGIALALPGVVLEAVGAGAGADGSAAQGRAVPLMSPHLAHASGHVSSEDGHAVAVSAFRVGAVRVEAGRVLEVLEVMESGAEAHAECLELALAEDFEFYALLGRYVRWLAAQQRVVPMLMQDPSGALRGLWQPWPADEASAQRLRILLGVMPPSARAGIDVLEHNLWATVEDFLIRVGDALCRAALIADAMHETIEGRDESADNHVAWLTGLLGDQSQIKCPAEKRPDLLKRVRGWISTLQERGPSSAWRLCLRLGEPLDLGGLHDLEAPGPGLTWQLSLHLQSIEDPSIMLDAQEVWLLPSDSAMVDTLRVDKPQELLLSELARAARVYKLLESAMAQSEPTTLSLNTSQAYEFLREIRPLLIEQGYGVQAPAWWDSPSSRLGVRLRIDSALDEQGNLAGASAAGSRVGLGTLVNYHWQVSLGDTVLSLSDFEKLASARTPLVMIGGRWVEVRPEDVQAAVKFIRENPGGEMELGKAIRLAYAADMRQTGLPVVGMDVTGWAAAIFGDANNNQQLPMLQPPSAFVGSLRPYQLKGMSWLAFLDRFGLGTCLADDMGLGKTIQFLAMLLNEKAEGSAASSEAGPTLLVVPMSVVGNWLREARRFAPDLQVLVHHGLERTKGETLLKQALKSDLVITTYALAYRDREHLEPIPWRRIALDEAQNIKNPQAKQTQAIRALNAPRRVALTGTPIENRLSELWSIMDFLNPGLLGTLHEFRTRFAVPIERYHDTARAKRLRSLVQPFVLRRLKTDPSVIADLPEKVETKDYCYLTPEQASLYESTVKSMLATAEATEGIQRRGIILAGLVKLKQICNHPHLFLRSRGGEDETPITEQIIAPARSGKCVRLVEMLDEVVASSGQALVFTQFRQMGVLLANMLRHELDREVLLLHGGTTAQQRDQIVANFQKGDGSAPILVLSLKAGGVGLNLTAANHVFHFDRWWNPAVESQATDRAYRIGQTRTVQVHKFVVAGTLEERIDQMIEQKTDLAANVIGSGESWLTELSLNQLRDVLMLRPESIEPDENDGEGEPVGKISKRSSILAAELAAKDFSAENVAKLGRMAEQGEGDIGLIDGSDFGGEEVAL
jgi:hypothetical protein